MSRKAPYFVHARNGSLLFRLGGYEYRGEERMRRVTPVDPESFADNGPEVIVKESELESRSFQRFVAGETLDIDPMNYSKVPPGYFHIGRRAFPAGVSAQAACRRLDAPYADAIIDTRMSRSSAYRVEVKSGVIVSGADMVRLAAVYPGVREAVIPCDEARRLLDGEWRRQAA